MLQRFTIISRGISLLRGKLISPLLARVLTTNCLILTMAFGAFSQERNLTYIIKKSGSEVGRMLIKEIRSGTKITLNMETNIKTDNAMISGLLSIDIALMMAMPADFKGLSLMPEI